MDFFTVPTLTFGVLYCFFVIDHDRRKILHLNVTQNPSAPWVALQLRQAWAYDQPQRFLIFDRDAKFNADVVWRRWRTMGCGPCEPPCEVRGRTASRSAGSEACVETYWTT